MVFYSIQVHNIIRVLTEIWNKKDNDKAEISNSVWNWNIILAEKDDKGNIIYILHHILFCHKIAIQFLSNKKWTKGNMDDFSANGLKVNFKNELLQKTSAIVKIGHAWDFCLSQDCFTKISRDF